MLQQVDQINIQASPAMLAAVLPRIRRVVAETTATERELIDRGVLARLQMKAGQTAEAEHELRAISEQAADRGEFRIASNMATDLANLLRDAGRYDDAMKIAERAAEYTRRGGFGPWTQLADEAQRLQILAERGDEEEVLRRVTELREQMKSLPDQSEAEEIIPSWNVRETILDVGRSAALGLKNWHQVLDLNKEGRESKEERGAPALEMARNRFNDYPPLLALQSY